MSLYSSTVPTTKLLSSISTSGKRAFAANCSRRCARLSIASMRRIRSLSAGATPQVAAGSSRAARTANTRRGRYVAFMSEPSQLARIDDAEGRRVDGEIPDLLVREHAGGPRQRHVPAKKLSKGPELGFADLRLSGDADGEKHGLDDSLSRRRIGRQHVERLPRRSDPSPAEEGGCGKGPTRLQGRPRQGRTRAVRALEMQDLHVLRREQLFAIRFEHHGGLALERDLDRGERLVFVLCPGHIFRPLV